jgi:hypothetical protein
LKPTLFGKNLGIMKFKSKIDYLNFNFRHTENSSAQNSQDKTVFRKLMKHIEGYILDTMHVLAYIPKKTKLDF